PLRLLAFKLLLRTVSLVFILWGLYRHGVTPEWVMRSAQGHEVNIHSWFWEPPRLPDWTPVSVRWWRSLFIGGTLVVIGIQGWRSAGDIRSRQRHPNKTQQPTGAPSGAGG